MEEEENIEVEEPVAKGQKYERSDLERVTNYTEDKELNAKKAEQVCNSVYEQNMNGFRVSRVSWSEIKQRKIKKPRGKEIFQNMKGRRCETLL